MAVGGGGQSIFGSDDDLSNSFLISIVGAVNIKIKNDGLVAKTI